MVELPLYECTYMSVLFVAVQTKILNMGNTSKTGQCCYYRKGKENKHRAGQELKRLQVPSTYGRGMAGDRDWQEGVDRGQQRVPIIGVYSNKVGHKKRSHDGRRTANNKNMDKRATTTAANSERIVGEGILRRKQMTSSGRI